jgi:GT2 family glycosyltransferase
VTAPVVSVIVVSFNTREIVRRCLASVLRQGTTPLEVIVVDNASMDGTVEMVRSSFPEVTVVANPDNRGFAAANNQALEIAKGEFALVLNPDTEVRPGAIDAVTSFARSNRDAGVVGCRVLRSDGTQDPTLFRTMRLRDVAFDAVVPIRVARRFRALGYQRYAGIDMTRSHDVESVTGCFMLIPREVWQSVGMMDEDFFIYGEEAEWCHRIRKAGWKVRYFPGAEIVHHGAASTAQLRDQMAMSLTRSLLLLIQKTQGRTAAYFANILMLLRETPRAALHLVAKTFRLPLRPGAAVSVGQSAMKMPMHLRGLFRTDWRPEARKPPTSR